MVTEAREKMHARAAWAALAAALTTLIAGCSARDPVTQTPVYHIGTPTNRSSVNSWELDTAPINTQPGVYHGKPAPLKAIASQRGFEPDDPTAQAVLRALTTEGQVSTQYPFRQRQRRRGDPDRQCRRPPKKACPKGARGTDRPCRARREAARKQGEGHSAVGPARLAVPGCSPRKPHPKKALPQESLTPRKPYRGPRKPYPKKALPRHELVAFAGGEADDDPGEGVSAVA